MLSDERVPWVLSANGTVVVLRNPILDLGRQASEFLEEWGPVVVATPAGDFNVLKPSDVPGWIVTSHNDDIFTYVSPEEVGNAGAGDMFIGLTGRSKRDQDSRDPEIIYIEKGAE